MKLITDTTALEQFCQQASANDFITIDTEFVRETTFWPKICLIQMATDNEVALIDPLAAGLNLEAFYSLLRSNLRKVLHGCRQDIEIFYHATKQIPNNVMDTQIMAMACYCDDAMGYDRLVKTLLGRTLNKNSRITNWDKRPLSEQQLAYACADVTYLREVYILLDNQLKTKKRAHWIAEEMDRLLIADSYDTNPDLAWQRFATKAGRAGDRAVAYALLIWREQEAQARNQPRQRVLRDEVIRALAQHPPETEQDFVQMRHLSHAARHRTLAKTLLPVIQKAKNLAADDIPMPAKRFPSGNKPPPSSVLAMLKILLMHTSETHSVAPKLLTSMDELIYLATAQAPDCPVLRGWRYDIFGQYALGLLRGDLAITSEHNVTKLIPLKANGAASAMPAQKSAQRRQGWPPKAKPATAPKNQTIDQMPTRQK